MRKRRIRLNILGKFPGSVLFLLGFLAGMILPNLAWRMHWQQETIASFYLLGAFADRDISGKKYLLEILQKRGSWFFLCALCGFSIFGVPMAVLTMVGIGLEMGAILTMSILQFGFHGGIAGLGLFLPQYVVYLPVTAYFLGKVYSQSMDIWKNRGIFPGKAYRYTGQTMLCAMVYFTGILMEAYLNPRVVEQTIKFLKFF